jgi:hypothetical protein
VALDDAGISIKIYNQSWQLITLGVNQSITICGGISNKTESLTDPHCVRDLGVNQLTLAPHLLKRKETNGDTSGAPMTTPQQGAIFRTDINETSSLQGATTIGDSTRKDPWMATFNSGLSTLAKDDYGTRGLFTHEGAYALLTDAPTIRTLNVQSYHKDRYASQRSPTPGTALTVLEW